MKKLPEVPPSPWERYRAFARAVDRTFGLLVPYGDLGRAGQYVRQRDRVSPGHAGRSDRYDFSARLAYLRETGSATSSCSRRPACPRLEATSTSAGAGRAAGPRSGAT